MLSLTNILTAVLVVNLLLDAVYNINVEISFTSRRHLGLVSHSDKIDHDSRDVSS